MAQLKVGVIGFRNNGRGHARMVAKSSKTKLAGVADLVEGRRKEAHDLFGAPTFGDYQELIARSDMEAVIVSLPVPLHYPAVMAALEAGKHVLCEKPPASNAAQTRKMVDLARRKGLVLTWGLQRRYLPQMHAARRAIGAGRLGKIYRINAQYNLTRSNVFLSDPFRMGKDGGGVFFDLGVHVLDMAWSLLGCPKPTRVVSANNVAFARWNCLKRPEDMGEDNALALVFFEGGAVVCIETCFVSNRPDPTGHMPRLMILGDKGGLDLPSLAFVSGGPKENQLKQTTLKTAKSWQKNAGAQMHSDFVDAVQGQGDLLIEAEHGAALMQMIDAVIRSSDQGREIRLK